VEEKDPGVELAVSGSPGKTVVKWKLLVVVVVAAAEVVAW